MSTPQLLLTTEDLLTAEDQAVLESARKGCCNNHGSKSWLPHILANWLRVVLTGVIGMVFFPKILTDLEEIKWWNAFTGILMALTALISSLESLLCLCRDSGYGCFCLDWDDYRKDKPAACYRVMDTLLIWSFVLWGAWGMGALTLKDDWKWKTGILLFFFVQLSVDTFVTKGVGEAIGANTPDNTPDEDSDNECLSWECCKQISWWKGCWNNRGSKHWSCHILTNVFQVISCLFIGMALLKHLLHDDAEHEHERLACKVSTWVMTGGTVVITLYQIVCWCCSPSEYKDPLSNCGSRLEYKDYRDEDWAKQYRWMDIILDWCFAAWVVWATTVFFFEGRRHVENWGDNLGFFASVF